MKVRQKGFHAQQRQGPEVQPEHFLDELDEGHSFIRHTGILNLSPGSSHCSSSCTELLSVISLRQK